MKNTRKFAVLTEAKNAEVHEGELPEIGENQVLVEQKSCNICTTDYGQWLGLREHQPYPMAGGHEGSGTIVKMGSKVRGTLKVGDHVAVNYNYCGECESCRMGRTSECEVKANGLTTANSDGYYGDFGFGTYSVRDANTLIKMNPKLPFNEAGFLEPLATVVKGMRKLRLSPMEKVVVIGAGTMGLLNAKAAKAYGAEVIVTELMDKKTQAAQSMGFDVIDANKYEPIDAVKEKTDGKGADVVILAVGATAANDQALKMVKHLNGRVLFFAAGYPAPSLKIDSNIVHYRKIELIGTYGADIQDFSESAKLLNQGQANVSDLIETSVPLDEIQRAFEIASTPGNYRVSVLV